MKALLVLVSLALLGAAPPAPVTCAPVPPPPTGPGIAANSTYASDDEPPTRFRSAPKGFVKVRFGPAAIDDVCGRPPCNMVFLGCTRGDVLVLPDPFTTSDQQFARIARHEMAHFAGWPASHGL